MSARTYLIRSAVFVLLLTAAVIVTAGYYERPALLINQVAFIAGPSFVPFALLSAGKVRGTTVWLAFAVLLSIAWGYVASVDSRPYQGGGASFAVFAGWAGCVLASLAALLAVAVDRLIRGMSVAPSRRGTGYADQAGD